MLRPIACEQLLYILDSTVHRAPTQNVGTRISLRGCLGGHIDFQIAETGPVYTSKGEMANKLALFAVFR